ncbi:MAG TPA: hypothetical protein VI636_00610, partial [Candidatus Angelobacter sp.]
RPYAGFLLPNNLREARMDPYSTTLTLSKQASDLIADTVRTKIAVQLAESSSFGGKKFSCDCPARKRSLGPANNSLAQTDFTLLILIFSPK